MGGRFYPFSLIVSNIGLSAIITYSVPVLMLIYPPAITLILLALLGNAFQHNKKSMSALPFVPGQLPSLTF